MAGLLHALEQAEDRGELTLHYFDESGFSQRSALPYAWSPVGCPLCHDSCPLSKIRSEGVLECQMAVYSNELKEQIVRKMLPPGNQSVSTIHQETGISEPTLYAWKKQYRERGFVVPSKSSHPNDWDARSKLAAVIQTAAMNEAELSAWCREQGIYKEQLAAWKAAFESMSSAPPASPIEMAAVLKKNRTLQKELDRKDKALAETAALLALSKKAWAIWGNDEDN